MPSIPEVNIALLGSLGVGKSALTVKYITKRFISEYDAELEDTYSKLGHVDHQDVLLRIMDTCDKDGKDPDRYFKWADAFLVVYSVTSRPSFEQAQQYLEMIVQQDRASPDSPLVLVGNKVDMERYRQVSKVEGSTCAAKFEATFFETTAAEDYDEVEKVFHDTVRLVLRERETLLRSSYLADDKMAPGGGRAAMRFSPGPRALALADRNPKFKLFNKGFKIFQS